MIIEEKHIEVLTYYRIYTVSMVEYKNKIVSRGILWAPGNSTRNRSLWLLLMGFVETADIIK